MEIKFRQMPEHEYMAKLEAQGVPVQHYAFRCPRCGHIQSFSSLARHMSQEQAQSVAYYCCEGRFTKDCGCDWTLGGLFRIHTLEVIREEDGEEIPSFELASAEEAKTLMKSLEGEKYKECPECGSANIFFELLNTRKKHSFGKLVCRCRSCLQSSDIIDLPETCLMMDSYGDALHRAWAEKVNAQAVAS